MATLPCDEGAPCVVGYQRLREGQEPPQRRSLTRDQFEALPKDRVAIIAFRREEYYAPLELARQRGFASKGLLTVNYANDWACTEDDFFLLRWKAAALGFDGILVERDHPCTATALVRVAVP